jgi:hypothetical protein
MLQFDTNFILSKLDSHGIKRFSAGGSSWKFSCPICREGKSYGKKQRCFLLKDGFFFCHNCSETYTPYKFFNYLSPISYKDFVNEYFDYSGGQNIKDQNSLEILNLEDIPESETDYSLPSGSICLDDETQLAFYKNDYKVKKALEYCKARRLFSAINKVPLYYTEKDFIHKNRIILPYFENGRVSYYQSRLISETGDQPKYLSKTSQKTCFFNQDNIAWELPYIFIFEGPIDSMFVQNGIGMGGLTCNKAQKDILNIYKFTHDVIFVLDNQLDNKEVVARYLKLEEDGEKVFLWSDIKEKDINEWAVKNSKNKFDWEQIVADTGSPLMLLNR